MRTVIALAALVAVAAPAEATTHKKAKKVAVAKKKTNKSKAKKLANTKHANTKHANIEAREGADAREAAAHADGRGRVAPRRWPRPRTARTTCRRALRGRRPTQMKAANKACEATIDRRRDPRSSRRRRSASSSIRSGCPVMSIAGIAYMPAYGKIKFRARLPARARARALGPELKNARRPRVHYGSIYRNTNVRVHGQTKNILSRHALGLAMDIKAFVDDTAASSNVELEYLKGDPLLHAIEDTVNESNDFRIVLTPGERPAVPLRIIFISKPLSTSRLFDSLRSYGRSRRRSLDQPRHVRSSRSIRRKAPKSVENFLAYVDAKHYDGTIFHRVIPTFMVQGGGYDQQLEKKPIAPADPERGRQRPQEHARHRRDGAHRRSALGDRAVLRQRRRQRVPRSPGQGPRRAGATPCSARSPRAWTSSTRSRA